MSSNPNNIEELQIINKEKAIECLGGQDLFENMMEGFEELSLKKSLVALKIAMDDLDYLNIRMAAHSLKGSASYLQAERVAFITAKMQADVEKQLPEEIFKDYAVLIKQAILLRRAIRFHVQKKNGIFCEPA